MKRGAGKTRRRVTTLNRQLTRIVIMCWVIPLIFIPLVGGLLVVSGIDSRTRETASETAHAAAFLCVDRINTAVESSRRLSYDSAIYKLYGAFLRTGDSIAFYGAAAALLDGMYRFDDKFRFACLVFTEGEEMNKKLENMEFYSLNESLFPSSGRSRARSAYTQFRQNDLAAILEKAAVLGTGIGFLRASEQMYLFRNLYLNGSASDAVLITQLNTEHWMDSLENVPWSKNVSISVNHETLKLREDASMPPAYALMESNTRGVFAQTGQDYSAGEIEQNDYKLYYCVAVDNSVLLQSVRSSQLWVIMTVPLVLPFLLYMILFITRNLASAVRVLIDGAKEIDAGNFGVQVGTIATSAEFRDLTESFNSMSARLKSQIDKIHQEEADLNDARIKALQSQINPHFLGNTLEIINWEARLGNNAKVSRMIESLSTMLDAAIGRTGPTIRLSQEMMYVDAYLYIVGERYGKRLTITREVDSGLLDFYVPRLILQPAMENAVEHGIAPNQRGTLALRIYRDESNLYFDIENSGELSDDDEKRISAILSREGEVVGAARIGIRNTDERLKILYGKGSGLTISRTPEHTVLTRMIIPLQAE